ncbi:MAG: glutamate-1-semialdehyde-2,1-aminomutase [Pedosphaera sp.]|nr:glutamate-1-semialdehyde-2,1-aminomutase [Pedosphaera sp.]
MSDRPLSEALFAEALKHIPGGVNSPVRAFRGVGGNPFFVCSARGAHVTDIDGHTLLDYVGTWGPAILGHARPSIIGAVKAAAEQGTSFGIPNPFEVDLARRVKEYVPGVEKVRFCNSGTEACMTAIRLARGFTKRDTLVKFDGCYHGHADSLLVKAGSGALTLGNPDSAGVPADFARHTAVLPFNDFAALRSLFRTHGRSLAAVIVEGIPANAGLFLPEPGFYEEIQTLCRTHGTLFIMDEVMTGFRLGLSGAQGRFCWKPDLSCFGKIIGGGLPVGAIGGRAEIMDYLAPLGPVYQAGTLSGNPLAMAAGLAALGELADGTVYARLETLGGQLRIGMEAAARLAKVDVQWQSIGSMFCGYFCGHRVRNLADAMRSDRDRFARFFHGMLAEGIYFAPSQFEAGFLSAAHTVEDIEGTVRAAERVLRRI